MLFGTIVFSFGVIFFFVIWMIEQFESIRNLITHFGFRIIADVTVESDFLEKKIEAVIERTLKKEMSNIIIKLLDERDENNEKRNR